MEPCRLSSAFYQDRAPVLAPLLLGKLLCRRLSDGSVLRFRITETECYFGEQDSACHAFHGKTSRTRTLYENGGTAYIYLCYGIHSLFNVVTGPCGFPEAVLIRGTEQISGPGRLTKAMQITRELNGVDLCTSQDLWIEEDGTVFSYVQTPRIGIDYATAEDREKLWRFVKK